MVFLTTKVGRLGETVLSVLFFDFHYLCKMQEQALFFLIIK